MEREESRQHHTAVAEKGLLQLTRDGDLCVSAYTDGGERKGADLEMKEGSKSGLFHLVLANNNKSELVWPGWIVSFVSYPSYFLLTTGRTMTLASTNVNSLISLATHDCYYDGHAADRPQLPMGGVEGFIQMSRECAARQWSTHLMFLCLRRLQKSVRSSQLAVRSGEAHSISVQPPLRHGTMPEEFP